MSATRSTTRKASRVRPVTVSVLFSDVAGYSELTEPQLKIFAEKVLPLIAGLLEQHKDDSIKEINTWGDAILLVSSDTSSVAHFALDLRDLYHNTPWEKIHLPEDLNCRIGLHSGTVFIGRNPLRGAEGVVGTQINLAARIEPITPPGRVFATDTFVKLFEDSSDDTINCHDIGVRPLAKAFGTRKLYELLRHHETLKPLEPIDMVDTSHIKTGSHFLAELDSALQQKTSENLDLKSRLETTLAAFESLSDFLREVICYNQGEFIQYNFRAGELHKTLKDTWRDSPQNLTTLHTLCDDLEKFLYTNLKRISQDNFEYIKQYFGDRHVISPRVCTKVNFDKDGEQKIVPLFRDTDVNYLSEHLLWEDSGFLFVQEHGNVFFSPNIPERVANGEYVNARIDHKKAKAYWKQKGKELKREAQEPTDSGKEFQSDEEWVKCWKLEGTHALDPTSCYYKSTVIIPMTLWNNELTDEFRNEINKKLRETIESPEEISRIIFGYLCLDHVEDNYFNKNTDIHIGYIFADILSLYMVTQFVYTDMSRTFADVRGEPS